MNIFLHVSELFIFLFCDMCVDISCPYFYCYCCFVLIDFYTWWILHFCWLYALHISFPSLWHLPLLYGPFWWNQILKFGIIKYIHYSELFYILDHLRHPFLSHSHSFLGILMLDPSHLNSKPLRNSFLYMSWGRDSSWKVFNHNT